MASRTLRTAWGGAGCLAGAAGALWVSGGRQPLWGKQSPQSWPQAGAVPVDAQGRPWIEGDPGSGSGARAVSATLNYQSGSVASSLVRNGRVGTRRGPDGGDSALFGVDWAPTAVTVGNARHLPQPPTLDGEGFELHPHDPGALGFHDEQQIVHGYYREACELVRKATGAAQVVAFDHNVRCASAQAAGVKIKGGNAVQGPAHLVHTDYTVTSAPKRVLDLASPAKLNDTWRPLVPEGQPLISAATAQQVRDGGRFAIVTVWRSIRHPPVGQFPLAVCRADSVSPEDVVTFEIHYADRVGENYFAKHAPAHRWWYYPRLRRASAPVFNKWDTAGDFTAPPSPTDPFLPVSPLPYGVGYPGR